MSTETNSKENENPFPIEVFPKLFQDLTIDLHKTLNFPIDYTATAIITAVSTAIGTTIKLKVKSGWYEYASIYSCLIGNSGKSKTHPLTKIFSPIKTRDKQNYDAFVHSYKIRDQFNKLSKDEKSCTEEPPEPILEISVLTNFTSEALYKRLSENLRGCVVESDEILSFFEGMNNYSKSDQLGIYLSIWNNERITIDRKGNPIPININTPFLSIIGGLQPRCLVTAFSDKKLNNGFYQRFLFAFPEASLKEPINDNEMDNAVFDKYKSFIDDCFFYNKVSEHEGEINSRILNWTPEAKIGFYQWNKINCDLVNEYPDNIKGEIASKFDNHFVRLALLLQIMENPQSTEVTIESVEGAKKLCDYFITCSFKVLKYIQNPEDYLKSFTENKREFYKVLPENFTTAEAVKMGQFCEMRERTVKDFLKDEMLFKNIKHGHYQKTIKAE